MKVTVTPEVEAGAGRGGEDLYLYFVAEHNGDAPPVDEPIEVFLYVLDDWEGTTEVRDLTGDEPNDAYLPGLRVRYCTPCYEFEWEGTGEEALTKCRDHFRNPSSWAFCHKPGEKERLRCSVRYYVDGNAE